MASKNLKRKKLDLYWPTIFIVVVGVLITALFMGKYIGDYFISAVNSAVAITSSSSSPALQIKTLAKPTIVAKSSDPNSDKGVHIILPPSFNLTPRANYNTSVSYSLTPTAKPRDENKKPSQETSKQYALPPTTTPQPEVANNSGNVVDDGKSGKTDTELNQMLNTSSENNKGNDFERVELDNNGSGDKQSDKKESNGNYKIQAGMYQNEQNAEKKVEELNKGGYEATVVPVQKDNGQTYYRVEAGSFSDRDNAKNKVDELKKNNHEALVVVEE